METYCSQISQNANEPLIGTAPYCPDLLLIECPFPWSKKALETNYLPEKLKETIKSLDINLRPQLILTEETKKQGPYQVFFCHGQGNKYQSYKYEISSLHTILELMENHLGNHNRPEPSLTKHILVCAHAMRDRCCGKFGTGVYKEIKKQVTEKQMDISVWKTSHLGGHRFAPTLLTLPEGRMYGRVEINQVTSLLKHIEQKTVCTEFYRGLTLLEKPQQVAEGFVWSNSLSQETPTKVTVDKDREEIIIYAYYSDKKQGYHLKLNYNKNKYEVLGSCKDDSNKSISVYEIEKAEKI